MFYLNLDLRYHSPKLTNFAIKPSTVVGLSIIFFIIGIIHFMFELGTYLPYIHRRSLKSQRIMPQNFNYFFLRYRVPCLRL